MKKHAAISPCGRYRYWLERCWAADPMAMPRGYVNFVMLNPSTADAEVDDPTIRKCIGFAKRWGYDGMHVTNLFALRSTDPSVITHHADPFGPENPAMLEAGLLSADTTIVAWGANAAKRPKGLRVFCGVFAGLTSPPALKALRLNTDGSPQHPLYVSYDVSPVPFTLPPRTVEPPENSPSLPDTKEGA